MALESEIAAADRVSKRKAGPTTDHIKYIDTLVYEPGSRTEHRIFTAAAYQLHKEFNDYGTIRNRNEFDEFVRMLGLEEHNEWGRKLYSKNREKRGLRKPNRRVRKGK